MGAGLKENLCEKVRQESCFGPDAPPFSTHFKVSKGGLWGGKFLTNFCEERPYAEEGDGRREGPSPGTEREEIRHRSAVERRDHRISLEREGGEDSNGRGAREKKVMRGRKKEAKPPNGGVPRIQMES